jgi:hypothetical protein
MRSHWPIALSSHALAIDLPLFSHTDLVLTIKSDWNAQDDHGQNDICISPNRWYRVVAIIDCGLSCSFYT